MNILPLCSHGSQWPFGRVARVIRVSPCDAPLLCTRVWVSCISTFSGWCGELFKKTLHLSPHTMFFRAVAPFVPPLFTAVRSRRPVVKCDSMAAIIRRKQNNTWINDTLLVRYLCSANAPSSAFNVNDLRRFHSRDTDWRNWLFQTLKVPIFSPSDPRRAALLRQ